jgi:hypothetical protein
MTPVLVSGLAIELHVFVRHRDRDDRGFPRARPRFSRKDTDE